MDKRYFHAVETLKGVAWCVLVVIGFVVCRWLVVGIVQGTLWTLSSSP